LHEENLDEILRSGGQEAIEQTNYLLGLSYYFKEQYLISNFYFDRLMLRLPTEVHRKVYLLAKKEGKSLNEYISEKLSLVNYQAFRSDV